MSLFVLQYDYRSDNGPDLVGPFPSRERAMEYAASLQCPGWRASFCVAPLEQP